MRLLLAEDEKELANALLAVFKHNHYSVDVVYNGTDAYDWAMQTEYDGIILDIMMPGMNGLEVLQALRKNGKNVPILLLTAKSEIDDRVQGLDLGADDYLTKPFAMKELLARIRVMTRRTAECTTDILEFCGLTLDRKRFQLGHQGQVVDLGNKEFQMIEMLMSNPGQYLSAERFMEKVWGYNAETEVNVIWVYISGLRKKILNLSAPVEIRAARGIGYKLERV